MTVRQLYLAARKQLSQAGVDSPGVDAGLLAEKYFGLDRTGLTLHGKRLPLPSRRPPFSWR